MAQTQTQDRSVAAAWPDFPDTDAIVRSVGPTTYQRGRAYARQGRVSWVTNDPERRVLYASVRGNVSVPYQTLVKVGGPADRFRSSGRCTCPVAMDCKHVAAVLVAALDEPWADPRPTPREETRPGPRAVPAEAEAPAPPKVPAWERAIAEVVRRPEAERRATPIGLQLEVVTTPAPTATGRHAATLRVRLRPVVPSRNRTKNGRQSWVRSGVSWRDLQYTWGLRGYDSAHREALQELYRAHRGSYTYGETAVFLDEFGPALWPLLRDVVDAGVPLLPVRPAAGAVALSADPGQLFLDLNRDGAGGIETAAVVDVPGAAKATSVALVGDPAHGVVLDYGAAKGSPDLARPGAVGLLLAPLTRPLSRQAAALLSAGVLRVPAPDVERFLREYYPAMRRVITVSSTDGSVELPEVAPPRLALRLTYADQHRLGLEWFFRYDVGGQARDVRLGRGTAREDDAGRDRLAEQRLLRDLRLPTDRLPQLRGVGAAADGAHAGTPPAGALPAAAPAGALPAGGAPGLLPGAPGTEVLPVAPVTELRGADAAIFTEEVLLDLREQGVAVDVVGETPDYRLSDSAPVISVSATDTADGDWFDLGVTVELDGEEIPFQELFVALVRGESHLLLESGTYFSIERPELDQLRRLIAEASALEDRPPGELRLRTYQAGLWEELAALGVVTAQSERWQRTVGRLLAGEGEAPTAAPPGLLAELRPYQLEGYGWLSFLWDTGLGGILADDMGLGKTLQTLATVCRAKDSGDLTAPVLVVAPTSVVGNWAQEAARFAPGLNVVTITETQARRRRPLAEVTAGADVVITSYALFRIEHDRYQELTWRGLVLDEAQFVKNHQARTYQCARTLAAPFKLAITGTPLENSLMDLWSLLSIVAPGMYPDPKKFTETYRKPIERGTDPELLATLRRRIRPFIRRRTKEQVAADLPAKQEQVLKVQLNPRHRKIYQTHLQRERRKVLNLVDDLDKNRFTILRSLTLLRQLSLDPALVDEQYARVGSSKLDAFVEQITETVAGGHRALVFSQFTGFLSSVRDRLDAEGIEYCYLDGRTRNRAKRIAEFKTGTAPVFLISLKAGGFGLNLTEADYCFVLDPWWNPAAEAQAIDRTHRIGQDKNVMVYRLVAEETIEEKVVELQNRKRDLFDRVIDDGGELSTALTAQDIRELLVP
ncbi:DEAD/DEAH box helicase [Georgenia sp. TF02-10]|uniref:DEAD/DEAH box helicase n=1 Tax=Georgenia sp. TF02-10 TaxID=2917725 RepID=UPI001FA6F0E8|nr:DEAD/DEAH box helicase [Georgenia sp. TF02-10]UNX55094.1 DEAD/DEAH box helicase [Georgenia sp. TF02-10]